MSQGPCGLGKGTLRAAPASVAIVHMAPAGASANPSSNARPTLVCVTLTRIILIRSSVGWTGRPAVAGRAQEAAMARAKSPIPEGLHSVTPHLILDHAAPAIEWYKKALGAEEFDRAVGADGKIMH